MYYLRSCIQVDAGVSAESSQRFEGLVLLPLLQVTGPGRRLRVTRRRVRLHPHQAVRLGKRQRPQHGRIDHAEHCRRRSDTEGEGQHGNRGKSGRLAQLPQSEAKILAKRKHRSSPARKGWDDRRKGDAFGSRSLNFSCRRGHQ